MLAMPSTCRAARPTSAMRRGYSVCTSSACCEAASGRGVLSLRCAPICAKRERLLDYAAAHIQHMQKALTQMNLQIHHVITRWEHEQDRVFRKASKPCSGKP